MSSKKVPSKTRRAYQFIESHRNEFSIQVMCRLLGFAREADANGNITASFDYKPYGSITLGTSPNGPGYAGHVNDPDTELIYMQARYYDPAVGRFLSVDAGSSQAW